MTAYSMDGWGQILQWSDGVGSPFRGSAIGGDTVEPAFRLMRFDDAWRPLGPGGSAPMADDVPPEGVEYMFEDVYGGPRGYAHGASPSRTFPDFWPASFDHWPYAGDIRPHDPMAFKGKVRVEPVHMAEGNGLRFTITIQDRRSPANPGPQGTIRMPVGMEFPLPKQGRAFGTEEFFQEYRQLDFDLAGSNWPRRWYYLEGELFGLRAHVPGAESVSRPYQQSGDIHAGSPLAAFSEDGRVWWAVASEPDYGAAALWGKNRMRYFSTLYLPPGGEASWSFVVWRSACREPSQLLLQCSRTGGLFDLLNPRDFTPAGSPNGPILFANISRLPSQIDQIRALQPGLILLNYHYDHISSAANLYGEWVTYEGFAYSESKLKALIAHLRQAGVPQIGVYGTTVEQPENHRALREDDIVLDAWGRRFHAWEPGNWVIDGGNRDCGERVARAEAEFCRHYGLDAVFVDRLDHMGVNANPARVGKLGDSRLERIPSIRLGMIELNRQRMHWQRKLCPELRVGLNNTTGWSGVRYSDWNYLEGGNVADPSIPWLHHPAGVVYLRHTTPLFSDPEGADIFQVVGGTGMSPDDFVAIMRRYIGESLLAGVEASPYGDEWFVDPKSMFFNGKNSKYDPDESKQARIDAMTWRGGPEWRALWESVRAPLEHSCKAVVDAVRIVGCPDAGTLPPGCRMHARATAGGAVFAAVLNASSSPVTLSMRFEEQELSGDLPPESVKVWWGRAHELHSRVYALRKS